MRVLVLGGCGFIGSHIVDALVASGHQVCVYTRSGRNTDEFLSSVMYFQGDFCRAEGLDEALQGVDVVIHCLSATTPSRGDADYLVDINSNLVSTLHLLAKMEALNVKKLIYISSGGTVYGNPLTNPVTEETPASPICSYGIIKFAIENYLGLASRKWGLKATILRPSNVYGERQQLNTGQGLISTVIYNALCDKPLEIYGEGNAIRDFVYVRDVANLVVKTVGSDETGVYNVGSGRGMKVIETVNLVEKHLSFYVEKIYCPMRLFDVKAIVLGSKKAEKIFGWSASTDINVGIKNQIIWVKEQLGCFREN